MYTPFVEQSIQDERRQICTSCPYATHNKSVCSKCKCCIALKTKFKKASCPVGFWYPEDNK